MLQLNTLVVAEHKNSKLAAATLNTITAATALGTGDLSVLVAGCGTESVSKQVQNVFGVHKVLVAEHTSLENQLAEPLADLLVALHQKYAASDRPSQAVGRVPPLTTLWSIQAEVQSHSSALRYIWP